MKGRLFVNKRVEKFTSQNSQEVYSSSPFESSNNPA